MSRLASPAALLSFPEKPGMISSLHLVGEVEEFYSVKKMTSVIIDRLD